METRIRQIHRHESPGIRAGELEGIGAGDRWDFAFVPLQGFLAGGRDPIVGIEGRTSQGILGAVPLGIPRPDAVRKNLCTEAEGPCGFLHRLNLLDLPPEFVLHIDGVGKSGARYPFRTIEGSRTSLASRSACKPILMSALGRTGSTVATHTLAQHPEAIAFRPFSFEARAAEYWMEVLRNLGRPSSHLQILSAEYTSPDWWVGEREPPPMAAVPAPEMLPFLSGRGIERLARFCRTQAEAFYRVHARAEGRAPERTPAFVEKGSGNRRMVRLALEVWPLGRQFFLVRDLRDMFASMLAYNRKHDRQQFGRQLVDSDLALARKIRTAIVAFRDEWAAKADSCPLVRYEDFVLRPVETLEGLLGYLGLEHSRSTVETMLDRAAARGADGQARHRTTRDVQSSIGRYRRDLPPELLRACEESFGDLNAEFGYR